MKKVLVLERGKMLECKKKYHTQFANRPLFSPLFNKNFRQVSFAKAASSPTTRATFSSWRRKFKSFDRPLCSVSEFNVQKGKKEARSECKGNGKKRGEKREGKKVVMVKQVLRDGNILQNVLPHTSVRRQSALDTCRPLFFASGEGIPPPLPSL